MDGEQVTHRGRVTVIEAKLYSQIDRIAHIAALGISTIHLHCVGRNQERFIDTFGAQVLPRFKSDPPP